MRVGIVGAGSMGSVHAAAWSRTGAEFVGISAQDAASAERLAAQYGVQSFPDLDSLLPHVDVIDLCVPSDLHRPMTEQAAAAGKHVVCEKPMALNLTDAQAMMDACEAAGVRLFIAHVVRFFPQYRTAAESVKAGDVGDLGVLRLKRVAYTPYAGTASWFADETRSGGMVFDLMIHDLDYARMVGGPVEHVFAKAIPQPKPEDIVGTPRNYVLATLRFTSGAMALVEGGWAYPPGTFRTSLDIAGREGLLEWSSDDTATLRTFLETPEGAATAVGLPTNAYGEDPYTTEIQHVHDALRDGTPFAVTPDDALEAVRLAMAVRQSIQTGQVVKLAEVV